MRESVGRARAAQRERFGPDVPCLNSRMSSRQIRKFCALDAEGKELLRAAMEDRGLSARAHENLLTVNLPHLPSWLNTVEIRNLRVGDSSVSMVFRREDEITSFSLLSREGDLRVVMEE